MNPHMGKSSQSTHFETFVLPMQFKSVKLDIFHGFLGVAMVKESSQIIELQLKDFTICQLDSKTKLSHHNNRLIKSWFLTCKRKLAAKLSQVQNCSRKDLRKLVTPVIKTEML